MGSVKLVIFTLLQRMLCVIKALVKQANRETETDLFPFQEDSLHPLYPNISKHILHTVFCTFSKVLTRRICLTIRSFLS